MTKFDEYPTSGTEFTLADREKLDAIHAEMLAMKALIAQVEPFLESFMGGGSAPKNPMMAIMGSLMGGGR
jgi:hypothetical protein